MRMMRQRTTRVNVCETNRMPIAAPRAVVVDESLTSLASFDSLHGVRTG